MKYFWQNTFINGLVPRGWILWTSWITPLVHCSVSCIIPTSIWTFDRLKNSVQTFLFPRGWTALTSSNTSTGSKSPMCPSTEYLRRQPDSRLYIVFRTSWQILARWAKTHKPFVGFLLGCSLLHCATRTRINRARACTRAPHRRRRTPLVTWSYRSVFC